MAYCLSIKNKQPAPETVPPKKNEPSAPILGGRPKPLVNSVNKNNSLIKVQDNPGPMLTSHPSVPSLPDLTNLPK